MRVLVCSTGTPEHEEPQLAACHWMAERTVEELGRAGHHVLSVLGPDCRRGAIDGEIKKVDGFVGLDHGMDDRFGPQADPLLDPQNVGRLRGAFVHLIACLCANDLGRTAIAAGVRVFAGYDAALIVEWEPRRLPTEVQARLERLVTTVSRALASGGDAETPLRKAVATAADEVADWLAQFGDELDPEDYRGLEISAHQFVERLVVLTATADLES